MAICSNAICGLLTQGKDKSCIKDIGGNSTIIYAIPRCYIESYTDTYTDNVIDDIVLDTTNNPSAQWYQIVVNKDSITTLEEPQLPGKFILQTVTFTISNYTSNADTDLANQEATDFSQQLVDSDENVFAIKNNTGVWHLFGKNIGMGIASGSKSSGAVYSDVAGNTLTFTAGESFYAPVLSNTYVF